MDSAAEEEVLGRLGCVTARLFGVLSGFIPSESLSFGRGTVLAARWNHRRSLDVDLFCEPAAYDALGPAGRARLEAAIKTIPGCAEEPTWCDSIATYAEIDGLEATLLPRTVGIGSVCTTRLAGTRLVLQSNAQILYAKISRRMYAGGEIAARDAYDLVCAQHFDPSALQFALACVDPWEIHVVREIIRMMPAERLIDDSVKPLIDPCFRWTAAELRGAVLEALDLCPRPIRTRRHRRAMAASRSRDNEAPGRPSRPGGPARCGFIRGTYAPLQPSLSGASAGGGGHRAPDRAQALRWHVRAASHR